MRLNIEAIARSKIVTPSSASDALFARNRIDLRADPEWVARVERQAERLGINVSAYVRLAVSRALENDEATDPKLQDGNSAS